HPPPEHPISPSISEVLSSVVDDVSHAVNRNVGGAQLLQELLGAPWLHALLQVLYDPGQQVNTQHAIMTVIQKGHRPSAEARELYGLLGSPHMQALLSSHDSVAQSDYGPVLPPLPDDLPEDEEAVRIVCLVKNNQPLGATIRRDEDTGGIYIARVIHGGLADRSGLLHPGDLVVEVNGHPVGGLDPEQVIQMLIHSQGTILFKVIPKAAQSSSSQKPVYMRAMVDYFPQQDSSIPCPDAGMAFSRGDLLEVVDQSDGQWWQARKLPCAVSCAGLIPSARASGVGVSELRKRLIKLNPSTFQGPVPHTTRPMGAGEQTGREYHFVTKELFEYMVCNHRFVEYGEYRGHLYGTSTDAIDDVLKRGRMCVIDVEPHSIQPLRTRKLKPYVIFIKAPGPERLRQTRRHARLITNCSVNRAFTDDFVELEEASRLMEAKYKHFFDCVLVNDDLQDACMQLCSVIQQAQEEPQWIPVSWGRPEE
uniref:Membrane protein, palmitoylated 4a (MAGUK p55 subfamily member 4) n=1 Tax=Scophthalmus maximus TaxID=52904 RepID=A0A8D3E644_SCOMX